MIGLWSPAKAADEDDDDEVIDIAPGAHSILINFVASFGLAWFNMFNLVSAWRQQNQKPLSLLFSFVADGSRLNGRPAQSAGALD